MAGLFLEAFLTGLFLEAFLAGLFLEAFLTAGFLTAGDFRTEAFFFLGLFLFGEACTVAMAAASSFRDSLGSLDFFVRFLFGEACGAACAVAMAAASSFRDSLASGDLDRGDLERDLERALFFLAGDLERALLALECKVISSSRLFLLRLTFEGISFFFNVYLSKKKLCHLAYNMLETQKNGHP